jgi:hypothetical protein
MVIDPFDPRTLDDPIWMAEPVFPGAVPGPWGSPWGRLPGPVLSEVFGFDPPEPGFLPVAPDVFVDPIRAT